MASLAQNVGEKPWNVHWDNYNTEFEGESVKEMDFSVWRLLFTTTLVYLHSKKNIIVPDIQMYHAQESQRPGKRNTIKKYRRFDPIRCVAEMGLARSVLTYRI